MAAERDRVEYRIWVQEAKADGIYPVYVTAPGDLSHPMHLPFERDELRRLLAAGKQEQEAVRADEPATFGHRLTDELFDKPMASLFGQVASQEQGARLRLQIDPPELAGLPWEFLHDGQVMLAASASTPSTARRTTSSSSSSMSRPR